jgi:hypothetical protein
MSSIFASTGTTAWRKSSYSTNNNDCVEVATDGTTWAVRDSKDPGAGYLTISAHVWQQFTERIKRGTRDE